METNQLKYYVKIKTIIEFSDTLKIDGSRKKRIEESIKKIENNTYPVTPRHVD